MSSLIANSDKFNEEYKSYFEKKMGDEAGRRKIRSFIESGNAYWAGVPTTSNCLPNICSKKVREHFIKSAETVWTILQKIVLEYRTNAEYRKEFSFDPRVDKLILNEKKCPADLPFMRMDVIHDNETDKMYFCEFNADACGGMTDQRETAGSLRQSEPYMEFAKKHEIISDEDLPFEGWVKAFTGICKEVGLDPAKCEKKPRLAIAVCFDGANQSAGKLVDFITLFEKEGFVCSVFDVREFSYDGDKLIGHKALLGESEVAVDCIWRFTLMVDLLAHWEEVADFVRAISDGKILSVAGFETQIAHDKQVMAVMHGEKTKAFLTPEERAFVEEYVPFTALLDDERLDIAAVKAQPEKWIVKPTDWYATKNVVSGNSCTKEEWADLIDEKLKVNGGKGWLVQRFYKPRKAPAVPLYGKEEDFTAPVQEFGILYGIFLHCGKYGGMYLRQGPEDVIGDAHRGICTPMFFVDEE